MSRNPRNVQEGAWQLVHALHGRLAAEGDPDLAGEIVSRRDEVTGLPRR